MKKWPTLRNKADLESFFGLIIFLMEDLDRFADTAACLHLD